MDSSQAVNWTAHLVMRNRDSEYCEVTVKDIDESPRKRKNEESHTSPMKQGSVVTADEFTISPKRQRQCRSLRSIGKERRVTFAEPENGTPDKGKGRAPDTPGRLNASLARGETEGNTQFEAPKKLILPPINTWYQSPPPDSSRSDDRLAKNFSTITTPAALQDEMQNFNFDEFLDEISTTDPFIPDSMPYSPDRAFAASIGASGELRQKQEQEVGERAQTSKTLEHLSPDLKEWLAVHCTELDSIIERTRQIEGIIRGGQACLEKDLTPELAAKLEEMIHEVGERQAEILPSLSSTLHSATSGVSSNQSNDMASAMDFDYTFYENDTCPHRIPRALADRATQTDETNSEKLCAIASSPSHYPQNEIFIKWNANNNFTGEYLATVAPAWSTIFDCFGTSNCAIELERLKSSGERFTREESRLINTAQQLNVRYRKYKENVLKAMDDTSMVKEVLKEELILLQIFEVLKQEVSACYEGDVCQSGKLGKF